MTDLTGPATPFDAAATKDRRGFLRATSWSFLVEAGGQVVLLLFGVLLAALVGPETYGIVAMATVYLLLIDLVQRQGIVGALIQRRHLTDGHASSAFWLVMGLSIVMTAMSVALAGWWADVNNVPLLAPVIIALSALLPLKALIVVQEALLRRQMDFKKVALRTTVAAAIGGAAGLVVAVQSPSPWALVVQQLTAAALSVVLLWWSTRWRPRWAFSWTSTRQLLGFSTASFLASIGALGGRRGDLLVIGLFFGPAATGIYAFGARLVDALYAVSVRPMQAVALPELSPFQDRLELFRSRLRRVNRTTAVLGLPALGVLVGVAEPLTSIIGPAWSAAAVPLQVLAITAVIMVVIGPGGPSLQAVGRPHLLAAYTWFTALTSVGSNTVIAMWLRDAPLTEQVLGLALTRLAWSVLVVLVTHLVIMRVVLGMTISTSLSPFGPAALAGAAAALAGIGLNRIEPLRTLAAPLPLIIIAAAAAVVGCIVLLAADHRIRSNVLTFVRPSTTIDNPAGAGARVVSEPEHRPR
jgi:O-antigen/teichoic acid export membrane protein